RPSCLPGSVAVIAPTRALTLPAALPISVVVIARAEGLVAYTWVMIVIAVGLAALRVQHTVTATLALRPSRSRCPGRNAANPTAIDRKSTRLNSTHTSISYDVSVLENEQK